MKLTSSERAEPNIGSVPSIHVIPEPFMNRYPIPAINSNHEVVVGWDNPMRTLFAQVRDLPLEEQAKLDDEIDPIVLWIGQQYDEQQDLEKLQTELASFAQIPDNVLQQLQTDMKDAANYQPSLLQLKMERLQSNQL